MQDSVPLQAVVQREKAHKATKKERVGYVLHPCTYSCVMTRKKCVLGDTLMTTHQPIDKFQRCR